MPQDKKEYDEFNEMTKRREEANKKTEELAIRLEKAKMRETMDGKAEAGKEPAKPKELTDEEYAKSVIANEVPTEDTEGSKA